MLTNTNSITTTQFFFILLGHNPIRYPFSFHRILLYFHHMATTMCTDALNGSHVTFPPHGHHHA